MTTEFLGIKIIENDLLPPNTIVCGPDMALLLSDPERWKRENADKLEEIARYFAVAKFTAD